MGREKVASAEIESYSRPPRESSGVSNEQVIISGSALTPETMPSDSPTHLMVRILNNIINGKDGRTTPVYNTVELSYGEYYQYPNFL